MAEKQRGTEKFHGAVVDHCGHENTRVFRDVKEVGETLEKLDDILGTSINPEVAIIYDWENKWAIDGAYGPRREKKDYFTHLPGALFAILEKKVCRLT